MDSCATHACWLLLTGRPAKLQPVYKAVLVETVFWKPSPASVRLPPVEAYDTGITRSPKTSVTDI